METIASRSPSHLSTPPTARQTVRTLLQFPSPPSPALSCRRKLYWRVNALRDNRGKTAISLWGVITALEGQVRCRQWGTCRHLCAPDDGSHTPGLRLHARYRRRHRPHSLPRTTAAIPIPALYHLSCHIFKHFGASKHTPHL